MTDESRLYNDLVYVCGLVEYIARKINNTRSSVMDDIGRNNLKHIFNYAEVYHCLMLERVYQELQDEVTFTHGNHNHHLELVEGKPAHSVYNAGATVPTMIRHMKITDKNKAFYKMWELYHSWMEEGLFDFDLVFYWQNPSYHLACYEEGKWLNPFE